MPNRVLFNDNIAKWVAGTLLLSGAYRMRKTSDRDHWFLWKSGIVAPVYCNTRQLISHPQGRFAAMAGLKAAMEQEFPHAEGVIGMATAGIGWAHTLAHLADLPAGYIRSAPKDHGLGGLVEYYAASTAKRVVLIDDLVASGGSIKKACDIAHAAGLEVIGVLSIVNWGFKKMHDELAGFKVKSLVSYTPIIEQLDLDDEAKDDLLSFYVSPSTHQWKSVTFGGPALEMAA
jgi:orotate phosphoribosyltransferase